LDPAQRRHHTLDAVRQVLLREAREQPLLLIFEDLHWIDGNTQAFLDSLVESLPTARLLLLLSYRPEYGHVWGSKTLRAGGLVIGADPLFSSRSEQLGVLTARRAVPAIYKGREFAAAGGLDPLGLGSAAPAEVLVPLETTAKVQPRPE